MEVCMDLMAPPHFLDGSDWGVGLSLLTKKAPADGKLAPVLGEQKPYWGVRPDGRPPFEIAPGPPPFICGCSCVVCVYKARRRNATNCNELQPSATKCNEMK